jgi:hypothetical protein
MNVELTSSDNFVINSGRYWTGASWTEYFPEVKSPDPLADSAFLFWILRHIGADSESYRLIRAIQQHTGVGVNGWSIKKKSDTYLIEIYIAMFPPVVAQKLGREMPTMQLSEFEPDLNYFMQFEQKFFGQPPVTYDQRAMGLKYLFALHFDLTDDIFRRREIQVYTLGLKDTPTPALPARPAEWSSYVWDKRSPPVIEQYGYVVDPIAQEDLMLSWMDRAIQKEGWPSDRRPDPRSFITPWLYEQTVKHRRLGLTQKVKKGGIGIYYRLDYDHFLKFLDESDYPQVLRDNARKHRDRMEHLLMDVAEVYRIADGTFVPFRTALYGTF